jgi:hypothetical protein
MTQSGEGRESDAVLDKQEPVNMCNCNYRQVHYRSTIFSHCQSSAYRFARETPKPRLPRVEACPSLASEWLRCSCSRARRKARGHHLPPTDSASDAFGGTADTYKSAILISCIFFIVSNKKGDNVKRSDASWDPLGGLWGKAQHMMQLRGSHATIGADPRKAQHPSPPSTRSMTSHSL